MKGERERPGRVPPRHRPKAQTNNNTHAYTLNPNQSLAVESTDKGGFRPPPDDPIAERAYSQLTFEQLVQVPQLIVRLAPWDSIIEIQRDCQVAANHYGYAVFVCDPEGTVLAYREPQ
jgi:hypothetical protein